MDKKLQIIERLNEAVRIIRNNTSAARSENRRLKQEFEALKAQNERLRESLKEKEEELRMARMATGVKDGSGAAALKQQIQRMIKDIDKSIALISESRKA